MSSDLDKFVTTQTILALSGVTAAGFGKALVLSPDTGSVFGSELVREYASATEVGTDWATTSPEYIFGNAGFSQDLAPEGLYVGRMTDKPLLTYEISINSVVDSTEYAMRVNGTNATFTSGVGTDNDTIVTGLAAAITALSISGLTVTTPGSVGSTVVQLQWNAGVYGYISLTDANAIDFGPLGRNLLWAKATTADPSGTAIATQLDNIVAENDDWYCLINPFPGEALSLAIALWVASKKKIYIQATPDSESIQVAEASGTDLAKQLKDLAYDRTAVIVHPEPVQAADSAWAGARLPTDPGTETWAFADLEGATRQVYTTTQQGNLEDRNANYYLRVGSQSQAVWEGTMADGTFIDQTRLVDYLENRLQTNVYNLLKGASPQKVAATDGGIQLIYGAIKEIFEELATGPTPAFASYTITIPLQANRSSASKLIRNLEGFEYEAIPTDAIHTVKPIKGLITL